jgi:hypothetical protein
MRHHRALFYSAAVFNWIAALILFAPLGIARVLGLAPLPTGGVYEQIAIVAIAAFGLGYWWVARDPAGNRSIVKLGLLAKLAVVAVVLLCVVQGTGNARLAVLVSGDLISVVLFAMHLRSTRT